MNEKLFKIRFPELLRREKEFRDEFREKRDALESLVQPIQEHYKECESFWAAVVENDISEIIIVLKNGEAVKIKKPNEKEKCMVASYLPFGIDYEKADVLNLNE